MTPHLRVLVQIVQLHFPVPAARSMSASKRTRPQWQLPLWVFNMVDLPFVRACWRGTEAALKTGCVARPNMTTCCHEQACTQTTTCCQERFDHAATLERRGCADQTARPDQRALAGAGGGRPCEDVGRGDRAYAWDYTARRAAHCRSPG